MDTEIRVNVNTYNISLLNMCNPNKVNTGYNSKILYNNRNFSIQSPLCVVDEIDLKTKHIVLSFSLSKNFNYFQFFGGFEQMIIDELAMYYDKSKFEILKNIDTTVTPIREVVNLNISKNNDSKMCIKIKISADAMFFDKEKSEISGLEIDVGDMVVCILRTNGVFCNPNNASLAWKTNQILKLK